MILINNILKERLLEKNLKARYYRFYDLALIYLYFLDDVEYCLISINDSCTYQWNHYKGLRHRHLDKPAGINHWQKDYGTPCLYYYKNDLKHRDDDINGNPQPAVILSLGKTEFFKNDVEFFPTKK